MQSTSSFDQPRFGSLGTDRIEIERIRPSLLVSSLLAVATFLAVVVADPFAPVSADVSVAPATSAASR